MATKMDMMKQQRDRLNARIRKQKADEKKRASKALARAAQALGEALAERHGAMTPDAVEALLDRLELVPAGGQIEDAPGSEVGPIEERGSEREM